MSFVPFGCIWDRLVAFTKLGAKQAELVQSFVPRSRIGIFRNERTRSTPLDPKLMFGASHSVWVQLAMYHYYSKLDAKQAELVQKFMPRSRVGIFRNAADPLHWTLNSYFGAFRTFWVLSGPFGCLT